MIYFSKYFCLKYIKQNVKVLHCFVFPKKQKSSLLQVIGFVWSIQSPISSKGELRKLCDKTICLFICPQDYVNHIRAPQEQNNNYHT